MVTNTLAYSARASKKKKMFDILAQTCFDYKDEKPSIHSSLGCYLKVLFSAIWKPIRFLGQDFCMFIVTVPGLQVQVRVRSSGTWSGSGSGSGSGSKP